MPLYNHFLMDNTVYIAGTIQSDIFHVGMTENNRDPEDRWRDPDYRAKMIYVPYKVAAFYTGDLRDEPVSKYILKDKNVYLLKEEVDIRSDEIYRVDAENPAEYIKNLVKEAIEYYNSDSRERLESFTPRFGQEDAIKEIVDTLLKDSNCLFAGYTGIGKTLISEVAVLRYFNSIKKGGLVLVTTPIPDTLNSFIRGLKNIDVSATREQKYSYMTKKEWENTSLQDVKKRTNNGEVIFLLLTAQDLFYDDKNGDSTIRGKYNKLNGKIDLWVRDEGHKFYRGERTSTLLDCLQASAILDLSATPYNFLDTYDKNTIVNRDLLWGSKHREYTKLPNIAIESYDTPFVALSDKIKAAYDIEEGYDPRKWFVRDDNSAYVYIEDIVETYGLKYVEVLPKNKNHLNVNLSDKRVSLDVLPSGEDGDGAADKYPNLAKVLNQRIKTRYFIDAWNLEQMSTRNNLTLEQCVDKLLEKYPALNILTCRKFTTGTDIPQISHINLFDKISSPTELSQLIGRAIRQVEGKNQVQLYNHCPGNQIDLALGIAARKSSDLSGGSQVEYLESIPFTKYLLNSIKPTIVTPEEIISQVNDYYRSLSNPRPHRGKLANAILQSGIDLNSIDFTKLGKYNNNINIKKVTVYSDKNKSKVKNISPQGFTTTPNDKKLDALNDMLISMGIEMTWIAYTQNNYNASEIIDSEEMNLMFGSYPLSVAKQLINPLIKNNVYNFFVEFLKGKKEAYSTLSFEEVHDDIFINTKRKTDAGLVYVPIELAYKLVDKQIQEVYNKGKRNFLVINALSGSIAYALHKKYPDANIFCGEYYSYFKRHLKNLIPECQIDDLEVNSKQRPILSTYKNMKFDVVISNPPFNNPKNKSKKGKNGNNTLYISFINLGKSILKSGGVLKFINPPSALTKSTVLNEPTPTLNSLIQDGSVENIDYTTESYFPSIDCPICSWTYVDGKKQGKVTIKHDNSDVNGEYDIKDVYFLPHSLEKIEYDLYRKIAHNQDGEILEVIRSDKKRVLDGTLHTFGYPKVQLGGEGRINFHKKDYPFLSSKLALWLFDYLRRIDGQLSQRQLNGIKIPVNGFDLTDEEMIFIDDGEWRNFSKQEQKDEEQTQ